VVSDEKDQKRIDLYGRRGYARVRTFQRLQKSLLAAPALPMWPYGISARRFRRDADEAAVHAALQEAFRDHWRPECIGLDDWLELKFARDDLDLGLWWVAWDGEEVAGCLIAYETPLGGYIDDLAVRRPWRRRGLARALLFESFAELRRRGVPRVYLGVDSENPTGAMHLYAAAGMSPTRTHLVYQKTLPAR
jgi:ribosomal protein S18 acetylase RimI-like enzyme